MVDYYTTKISKIGDFLIGFFGVLVINSLLGGLLSLVDAKLFASGATGDLLMSILAMLLFAFNIVAVVVLFKKGRRYIAIGMLATVVLPLLLFGACFLIFAGLGAFGS